VVLWTYGSGGATLDDSGPQLANGLFEIVLGQFARTGSVAIPPDDANAQSAGCIKSSG
jgi:hypothetical protein